MAMEDRLRELEKSNQLLLGNQKVIGDGQREMRRDLKCVRDTWEEYSPLFKLLLKREQRREAFWDAVIDKGLKIALMAFFVFVAGAVYDRVKIMLSTPTTKESKQAERSESAPR